MTECKFIKIPPNAKDITGKIFGRLTAIGPIGRNNHGDIKWLCVCKCGTKTTPRIDHLIKGNTTSCGCYQKESIQEIRTTHGMSRTKIYAAWANMKTRCYSPKYYLYKRYGGRGITVCDRWINSFETFFADMGDKPSTKHSLDRIDNNGNYFPENCRWATINQQNKNRRNTIFITYNGVKKPLIEYANEYGIKTDTLRARIYNYGWSIEMALTKK